MTLADAAQSAGGQRGNRGPGGRGGMPDMGSMQQMPPMSEGMTPESTVNAQNDQSAVTIVEKAKAFANTAIARVRDWLYEGVEVKDTQNVTGSLVKVEVGMQNDDYAQITSGLSEGDVVLYTASEETNRFASMLGGMMGGMMGGGRR